MTNPIEVVNSDDSLRFAKGGNMTTSIKSLQRASGRADVQRLDRGRDADQNEFRLQKASRDFEKIFMTYMVKDMWKTIPKDGDSETPGAGIYLEMIQSALAGELVKGKGMGIARILYDQMKGNTGREVVDMGKENLVAIKGR